MGKIDVFLKVFNFWQSCEGFVSLQSRMLSDGIMAACSVFAYGWFARLLALHKDSSDKPFTACGAAEAAAAASKDECKKHTA